MTVHFKKITKIKSYYAEANMCFKSSVTLLCLFSTVFFANQSVCLGNEDQSFDAQDHNALNQRHYIREMTGISSEGDYLGQGFNYNNRDEVSVMKRRGLHVPRTTRLRNRYLQVMRPQSRKRYSPDYLRVIGLSPAKISKRYYLRVMRKRNDEGNPLINQVSM